MNTHLKEILKSMLVISFLVITPLLSVNAQEASLAPEALKARNGEPVTLTLKVRGAVDIFALAYDLVYDPSVLTFIEANKLSFLSGCDTSLMAKENSPGRLIVGITRLGSDCGGVDGSGDVMEIRLLPLRSTTNSKIAFENNKFCKLNGESCDYVSGSWTSASIKVSNGEKSQVLSTETALAVATVNNGNKGENDNTDLGPKEDLITSDDYKSEKGILNDFGRFISAIARFLSF